MAEQLSTQRIDFHGMSPTVTIDIPEKWPWEDKLSTDRKIVVPEGMLKAAQDWSKDNQFFGTVQISGIVEAALRWLNQNPIRPTSEQAMKLYEDCPPRHGLTDWGAIEWQRRMFLAEEPPEQEARITDDELAGFLATYENSVRVTGDKKHAVDLAFGWLHAFRRGQKAKERL